MKNIFISSTFIDMQAERDLVQERVLPALRDEARKYGDNVGVIDLRWGVDTSTLETEEGAAKVLKVCLDEIDRSHPYMLIFLGERYGTMMREDQIEKSVRGREDKYTTDDYVKSITALEVEYGALSEKYGELNHCVVCFREPVVHMLDGAEKDLYAEHTEEGKRKLEALKERIKRDLGDDDRLITYSCTWDKSARQLVDFASNGQPLENVLTNCFVEMFRDDWKEYESLSWQDKEQLAFRSLMESKLRSFVGREALLEEYYRSVVNGTCPIILQGEAGSGKTAIMCKLVDRLQKEGKNVFAFFSGAGSMSTNAEVLVKQMVYYMENLLGVEEHFGENEEKQDETDDVPEKLLHIDQKRVQYDDWMEQLRELCFRIPEGEKVYFCIDAMDQLFRDEHVEKLDFFVKGKKTQVVASCTDEFVLPMEAMVSREVKAIPALSKEDAKTVAEGILASYSRNAYAAIEDEILKKKSIGNPLYISLLIQRLNMMDTEELRKAMNEEEIIALGTGIIREMPENTGEAIVAVIRNGIDKISEEEEALYEVLQYLVVSRSGLRMEDLQEIFAMQKRTLPVLDVTLLMKYLDSFFYVHGDGRVDFTHKVIRQGLLKELTDREGKEEVIKEYLKTLDATDELRIREGMFFARICKDEEFARELIERAYLTREAELVKAIKNEAVEDGGEFYCELIAREKEEKSVVCDYFQWRMMYQFGISKKELEAKKVVIEGVVNYRYEIFERKDEEKEGKDLAAAFIEAGQTNMEIGKIEEAFICYREGVDRFRQQYSRRPSKKNLQNLHWSYLCVLDLCVRLGLDTEIESVRDWIKEIEQKIEIKSSDLQEKKFLSVSYNNRGQAMLLKNDIKEARVCFQEQLKIARELYDMDKSEGSEILLRASYLNMGSLFRKGVDKKEAKRYIEKTIKIDERRYSDDKSIYNIINLTESYIEMCRVIRESSKSGVGDALTYIKKAKENIEEVYYETENSRCLQMLAICYGEEGNCYFETRRNSEAKKCYEMGLNLSKEIYKKEETKNSLNDLEVAYSNMIDILKLEGDMKKALDYYKELVRTYLKWEKIGLGHEIGKKLSKAYNDMAQHCKTMGRMGEAERYYEKAMKYLLPL